MSRKLIIKLVLLNSVIVIASIILCLIIISTFASHLYNKNAEEYLFVIAFAAALPMAIYTYKKAESGKFAYAVAVYLLTQISVGLLIFSLILLLFIAVKIYCAFSRCGLFPFA